ncbi:peptide ABC transporter substrate-binding protein [Candidatus Dojkabacteria bacterium]|nr:peptide ABC transporter substrate-binding protein [Candidatus Dojkabacteria bacterium]
MGLFGLFSKIENFLIKIRDFFWDYPEKFFVGKESFAAQFRQFFLKSRPFSHFFLNFFLLTLLLFFVSRDISAVLMIDTDTMVEGVIVGQQPDGGVQTVDFINPLIVTNMQLKRDIAELVYEPLIKVNQDGSLKKVLAESVIDAGDGKKFRIKIREGVKWHDGEDFTTDDVIATFNLLETLEFGNQTSSVYSKAASKIVITKVDDYRLEFSLKEEGSVIPNFFEVISFKILPAHLLENVDSTNIIYAEPKINTNPIGTGPFTVGSLSGEEVILRRNKNYYGDQARLSRFIFRLYKDQTRAVSDIKTGQIHSLIGINSDGLHELSALSNLGIYPSNVIYNQYWGIYFNLAESSKASLKEKKVRKAVDSAINKQFLVESLAGAGVAADGPIPVTSFAYTDFARNVYDPVKAGQLLDEAGWILAEGQVYRQNSAGEILELDMVYVDNSDREKIAVLIQEDLEQIGVKLNLVAKTIAEVNNDYLLPGYFDMLLYGVSTFIDPDRYELFHSSQIGYPNLNISSYKSEKTTVVIRGGKKETPPEVDYVLEKGRALFNESDRKPEYQIFQEIVLDELPVIYLYHPVYSYIANNRVRGIEMENMVSLEDRFDSITSWHIEI